MRVKRDDTIKIIAGKDKGKTGKILKVFPKRRKVLIEGLNLYKKHVRPKRQGEKGQVVLVPRPIDASNVMIVCASCGRATRVSYNVEGKNKIRRCKICKAKI